MFSYGNLMSAGSGNQSKNPVEMGCVLPFKRIPSLLAKASFLLSCKIFCLTSLSVACVLFL